MLKSPAIARELVSMLAVKEFMIQALEDETQGTQSKLKLELGKLFSLIKATSGYQLAER